MMLNNTAACPVCDRTEHFPLLFLENIPIMCNTLFSSPDEAKIAPRHDIELCCCRHCSHIYNTRFDPDCVVYQQGYENSLFYSPRYLSYAEKQAQRLIETYGLQGKRVIDIGCGKGEFLRLLCTTGECIGVGFDPSLEPDADTTGSQTGIRLISGTFTEDYPAHGDLYVSRHVLEHLHKPVLFLQNIHRSMTVADSVLYLEVPDGGHLLNSCSIWDLIYEHHSTFTPQSLLYILERTGFRVSRLQSDFQGQYLTLDATASGETNQLLLRHHDTKNKNELLAAAKKFAGDCSKKMAQAKNMLEEEQRSGRKVIVWGAGSKGITFLNQMKTSADIGYIVDVNPQKQGKYVPGTGQLVVAPEFLASFKPDTILIANEIYRNEIIKYVKSLTISPHFISI